MTVVGLNPVRFGILLRSFEITMGLLILQKGTLVKVGLAGTMIFLVGIAPLSIVQLPWLGLLVAEAYLLNKNFDITFLGGIAAARVQR